MKLINLLLGFAFLFMVGSYGYSQSEKLGMINLSGALQPMKLEL